MQAYMKSTMPCYGVPSPVARRVFTAVITAHPLPDRSRWEDTVLGLWRGATHREERYGALALAGHRRYSGYRDARTLDLYRELIVTGAWWDYVDDIASHHVGPILRADPQNVRQTMVRWSTDEDLWLRRTSIICQLGAKGDTDVDLLVECIAPNVGDRDFFIRKAIGWALRQYAKTDATWVQAYVRGNTDLLSPLSRREALKNVGPGDGP
jgi:3-methyladenine DNA glycosylase AlkD